MKTINLRDYYPHYVTDKVVEVPDEVFAVLEDFRRKEENYQRYLRRYKAFYSLDADNGIEKDISSEQLSPYEILEQQRIIALLYQGLATLSEKQQQRIHAHYFLGMSLSQIAKNEGRSVPTIKESIERGIKRLEKYFEEKENPPLNSALKLSLLIEGDFSAGQVSVIRSVRVYTPMLLKCEKVDTAAPLAAL